MTLPSREPDRSRNSSANDELKLRFPESKMIKDVPTEAEIEEAIEFLSRHPDGYSAEDSGEEESDVSRSGGCGGARADRVY